MFFEIQIEYPLRFVEILSFIFNCSMFIILIQKYNQTKIKALVYFVFAFFLFVIVDILPAIYDPTTEGLVVTFTFITISYGLKGLGFYLVLLFFATFKTEYPFSRGNVIFGIIIIINISMMAVCTIIANPFQDSFFPNETIFTIDISTMGEVDPVASAIIFYIFLNFLIILIQILLEFLWILSLIRTQIRISQSHELKKLLIQMKRALYVILTGLGLAFLNTPFSTLVFLIGLIIFFTPFIKNGILIFQEANLHRLMIVSKIGCPQYSYIFHPSEKNPQSADALNTEGMLFSGAIQAITTLLTEIIGQGENQRVKEIVLNDASLLIAHTPNYNQFVILMVQKSTMFVQNVLDQFIMRLGNITEGLPNDEYIEGEQIGRAHV